MPQEVYQIFYGLIILAGAPYCVWEAGQALRSPHGWKALAGLLFLSGGMFVGGFALYIILRDQGFSQYSKSAGITYSVFLALFGLRDTIWYHWRRWRDK